MSERGSVLISVLWIVLVLSLVSFSLAATVHTEMESTSQSFDSERAFFMAKGAAEIVFNSFSKQQPIPDEAPILQKDGEYIFPFESGEARVHFEADTGRIDINDASDKLLASMFDSLGVDRETRNRLVDSILDWIDGDDIPHLYGGEVTDYSPVAAGQLPRPRNGRFQFVEELLLVKNMTPEIFFGSLIVDTVTGKYRRVPGLRELVTVRSGNARVNPNDASEDVLQALPSMNTSIVAHVLSERTEKRFQDQADFEQRVPELLGSEAMDYFRFEQNMPVELVSKAVMKGSGVSRTVRMLFKREERLQILRTVPLLYKRVMETKFDRWRFE